MIVGLLPYLLWKFAGNDDMCKRSIISHWFKPEACLWAEDAYWDPQEECIKNTSDLMLSSALAEDDALYWEAEETTPKSPKCQKVQVEEESLNDSVSTIKTAVSTKKLPQSALKNSNSSSQADGKKSAMDSAMVTSNAMTLSQLTQQVSKIKQSHQAMLDWFDQLTKQMALLLSKSNSSSKKCPAGGNESGLAT